MKQVKTEIDSQRLAVIHIAKSLEKTTPRPKLVKEYACPKTQIDRLEEGSTGYNKQYKTLGYKWLGKHSTPLQVWCNWTG